MATTNLSAYNPHEVPTATGKKVAIVTSEWNSDVTFAMADGARETLLQYGVLPEDLWEYRVPGSFELIYSTAWLAKGGQYDAIIAIGCVVRGETPHFDYISEAVAVNLGKINAKGKVPVIMGVLTTNDMQQALDRAGGKHGNKGIEAAITALKMMNPTRILFTRE